MKKFIISIAALALLVSCTDLEDRLYDRLPEDMYPENETQGALLTVPVYSPLRELVDGGGWWFAQELSSDEIVCPTRLTDWDDGGKWRVLHTHTWTNTTEAVASMWSRFYRGVVEANQLIERLSPNESDPATATTLAKVRIMRAYYYYLLIDNYGDVPYVTTFKDAPEFPEKESRAVVFQNIITEIEQSIPHLTSSSTKTAVSKGMAFSLLAKLYLNAHVYTGTEQWEKAEIACDSVMKLGYSLEGDPLAPFVTKNENSNENIFTIPFDEDSYTGLNLHMRTLHYMSNRTYDMSVGPWNGFAVTEAHYNSYSDDDLRKAGFLVGQQYASSGEALVENGVPVIFTPNIPKLVMDASYTPAEIRMSGVRVAKFEIKRGAKENLSNDFPIFRYADVLLMKAEAMIRQGKNGDTYVNMVRKRAGLNDWSNTTLDQILEERGREMFWEAHRRQDLIRFGKFNNAWWEKDASTPDRKIFPIPQSEIDANPNLAK